jgi:hypothetical protein
MLIIAYDTVIRCSLIQQSHRKNSQQKIVMARFKINLVKVST